MTVKELRTKLLGMDGACEICVIDSKVNFLEEKEFGILECLPIMDVAEVPITEEDEETGHNLVLLFPDSMYDENEENEACKEE